MSRLALHTPAIAWGNPVNRTCPLNRGLVGWWLCGRPYRGATWYDLCGNNHGTLTNMDPATDWVGPIHSGAWGSLDFDGSNDLIDIPHSSDIEVFGSRFSVAIWLRANASGSYATIFSKGNNVRLHRDNATAGLYGVIVGLVSGGVFTTSASFFDATPHHLVLTYDATNINIYRDGQLATASAVSGTPTGGGTTNLSLSQAAGGAIYSGRRDDFRLWNRAITSLEVQQVYLDSLRGYPNTLNRLRRPIHYADTGGGGGGANEGAPFLLFG